MRATDDEDIAASGAAGDDNVDVAVRLTLVEVGHICERTEDIFPSSAEWQGVWSQELLGAVGVGDRGGPDLYARQRLSLSLGHMQLELLRSDVSVERVDVGGDEEKEEEEDDIARANRFMCLRVGAVLAKIEVR